MGFSCATISLFFEVLLLLGISIHLLIDFSFHTFQCLKSVQTSTNLWIYLKPYFLSLSLSPSTAPSHPVRRHLHPDRRRPPPIISRPASTRVLAAALTHTAASCHLCRLRALVAVRPDLPSVHRPMPSPRPLPVAAGRRVPSLPPCVEFGQ